MFSLGFPEILVILVILFLLFGAKKLPEIGEGLGKTIKELGKIREDKKGDEKKADPNGGLVADIKREVEGIPGLKEAREIKDAANKVKKITKFLK